MGSVIQYKFISHTNSSSTNSSPTIPKSILMYLNFSFLQSFLSPSFLHFASSVFCLLSPVSCLYHTYTDSKIQNPSFDYPSTHPLNILTLTLSSMPPTKISPTNPNTNPKSCANPQSITISASSNIILSRIENLPRIIISSIPGPQTHKPLATRNLVAIIDAIYPLRHHTYGF